MPNTNTIICLHNMGQMSSTMDGFLEGDKRDVSAPACESRVEQSHDTPERILRSSTDPFDDIFSIFDP